MRLIRDRSEPVPRLALHSRITNDLSVEVRPHYEFIDSTGITIFTVLAIDYPRRRVLARSKRHGVQELERLPAHWCWHADAS
jgi:hypothetical protein